MGRCTFRSLGKYWGGLSCICPLNFFIGGLSPPSPPRSAATGIKYITVNRIQGRNFQNMAVTSPSSLRSKEEFSFRRKIKRLKRLFPFYRSEGKTCIIYSDDGGKEWHGRVIDSATYNPSRCKRACMRLFRRKYTRHVHANESQVAELPGGKLYINSRTKELTKNRQSVIIDKDGIAKDAVLTDLAEPSGTYRWLAHCIPDFIRCGGCEGSVLSINHKGDKFLIFSNPAHKRKRENMSIRISRDEGKQWSEPLTLYSGPASYSDLVSVTISNNGSPNVETVLIGCLYECGDRGQYEASRIVLSLFDVAQLKKLTFKEGMKGTMNDKTPLVNKQIP
ncbi:putative sialidase-3-like [Apostichopus japonicus]|uniref:Putative sialidase-3-like n=1 Tax=Stichopus japonicus TaxID=307972 RepID=A0A2G8L660_STIJA|nr:putative sialidase-3-like [Apostichopus japonicus]